MCNLPIVPSKITISISLVSISHPNRGRKMEAALCIIPLTSITVLLYFVEWNSDSNDKSAANTPFILKLYQQKDGYKVENKYTGWLLGGIQNTGDTKVDGNAFFLKIPTKLSIDVESGVALNFYAAGQNLVLLV